MITLTESSRTAVFTALSTSSGIGATMVLSSSGRFNVIRAIGPSVAYRMVW